MIFTQLLSRARKQAEMSLRDMGSDESAPFPSRDREGADTRGSTFDGAERYAIVLLLLAVPVFAAVEGTVQNLTTDKPQGNAVVNLVEL